MVVDGWDKPLEEMTYLDGLLLENRGLVDTARLLCPSCHHPIRASQLGPDNREWVAAYPDRRTIEGFQVSPFDLPDYHTPVSLLRKMIEYRSEVGHFRNFALGLAYSDATNSILDEKVLENRVLTPISPDQAKAAGISGCVAGLDVGKTSWFVVGKYVYPGTLHIFWMEQIRLGLSGEGLVERVQELLESYRVIRFVTDAMPYTDSIMRIQRSMPEGWVLPAFYSLQDKKLPPYQIMEKDQSIQLNRTKTLDITCKMVNSSQVKFPVMTELDTARKHFQAIKRVERTDEGEHSVNWVDNGDDHYTHALNYCLVAMDIISQDFAVSFAPVPSVHQVEVGSKFVATH